MRNYKRRENVEPENNKVTNPLRFGLKIVSDIKRAVREFVGEPLQETTYGGGFVRPALIHRSQKKRRLLARRSGRV